MHIKGMVMHVSEDLQEHSRSAVKRNLAGQKGVIHAHFNEKHPELVLVAYDTDRTSSTEILARMRLRSH